MSFWIVLEDSVIDLEIDRSKPAEKQSSTSESEDTQPPKSKEKKNKQKKHY